MNWKDILRVLGPAILALNPKTAALAPIVVAGIEVAESIPGKKGPDKKAAVLEIVKLGAQGANAVAPREVVDVEATAAMVSDGIDVVIGAVNFVHKLNPPAPPLPPA
jgi:hypothetical protein